MISTTFGIYHLSYEMLKLSSFQFSERMGQKCAIYSSWSNQLCFKCHNLGPSMQQTCHFVYEVYSQNVLNLENFL